MLKNNIKSAHVTASVAKVQREKLEKLAVSEDRSISWLVNAILFDFFENKRKINSNGSRYQRTQQSS